MWTEATRRWWSHGHQHLIKSLVSGKHCPSNQHFKELPLTVLPCLSEFSHRNTLFIFIFISAFPTNVQTFHLNSRGDRSYTMHPFVLDSCPEKLLDSAVVWRTRRWISLFSCFWVGKLTAVCVFTDAYVVTTATYVIGWWCLGTKSDLITFTSDFRNKSNIPPSSLKQFRSFEYAHISVYAL